MIPLALAAAGLLQAAPAAKAPDKVHLRLTYGERNGLAFPSAGGVGLVAAPLYGGAAIAGALSGLGKLGTKLDAMFKGGADTLPKTTGETQRLMTSPEADALAAVAAGLPLSCHAHVQIEADLVWDEKARGYVVASGTYVWTGGNRSRIETKGHVLYCNLSGGGRHTLKRDEIRITFPEGKLSKALDPRAKGSATYDLKVEVHPKPEPVTGEGGWIAGGGNIFESTEKYTTGGSETQITDEYKVAPGGNDIMASGRKAKVNGPPLMFAVGLSYQAEGRVIRDGRGSFAETWTALGGGQATISWGFNEDQLVAEPKVQATVERGARVKLDGTGSRGRIKDYIWTFKPIGAGDEAPDPAAEKKGATAEVVLLDSMEITLTVSNGDRSDKKRVQVTVTPRTSMETAFEEVAEATKRGLVPEYKLSPDPVTRELKWTHWLEGGENVCAIDPPSGEEPMHILHPDPEKAAADDQYHLVSVADPGGPYDGFAYVDAWKVQIKRQARINEYLLPDGPPSFRGAENFYKANAARGHDVAGYLKAARLHEQMHTDRMKSGLRAADPAKDVEKRYGKDESRLRERIDRHIKDAARRVHDATKDPLNPEQWHGTLALPDFVKFEWHPAVFYVGGPNDMGIK